MDEAVLEAARAVRPLLVDYVGETVASELDAELAGLLGRLERGEDVENSLRHALQAHLATTVFLDRVRRDMPLYRPPSVVSAIAKRSLSGVPGQPLPVPADKYTCTHGDYVWYLMEVGVPVPLCPTHHVVLEPV